MNPNIAENVGQTASNVGHGVLDKVDTVTQSGRDLVDQGAKATQDLLGKGIEKLNTAQETLTNVQDKTVQQYDKLTESVSRNMTEKPLQTALIIAGVTAILTLLLTRDK